MLLKQLTPVQTNGYLAALMGAFTDADRADEFEAFVRKNLSAEAIPETTKAQATVEGLTLLTADSRLATYAGPVRKV